MNLKVELMLLDSSPNVPEKHEPEEENPKSKNYSR